VIDILVNVLLIVMVLVAVRHSDPLGKAALSAIFAVLVLSELDARPEPTRRDFWDWVIGLLLFGVAASYLVEHLRSRRQR
jgi:hypothetical protein